MKRNKTVKEYFENLEFWNVELELLRSIILETDLTETVKWGIPTYTFNGKNVVSLSGFKSYFGLWFFQGSLLKDAEKQLINAQEGVTKAQRQWRFRNLKTKDHDLIKAYISESIELVKARKSVKANRSKPIIIHDKLKQAFFENPTLQLKFDGLSLTNRRDFADYITKAKQDSTKQRRLEKIIPMILKGIGLNDKYK